VQHRLLVGTVGVAPANRYVMCVVRTLASGCIPKHQLERKVFRRRVEQTGRRAQDGAVHAPLDIRITDVRREIPVAGIARLHRRGAHDRRPAGRSGWRRRRHRRIYTAVSELRIMSVGSKINRGCAEAVPHLNVVPSRILRPDKSGRSRDMCRRH
jgi:hypothetical protein